jgi:hypothetical protein
VPLSGGVVPPSAIVPPHIGADGGVPPPRHVAAPPEVPGIVTSTVAVSPTAVSLNVAPVTGSVQEEFAVESGAWI